MALIQPAVVAANIRELIVHTSRGNQTKALQLAGQVAADLKTILEIQPAENSLQEPAQQTLFAIYEVLTLMGEQDLDGALAAARDAGKEWRARPQLD